MSKIAIRHYNVRGLCSRMDDRFRKPFPLLCGVAALLLASESRAGTLVTIEAINTFNAGCQPNLPLCISNVDEFRYSMTLLPGFSSGIRYTEGSVWASDFTEVSDLNNFDRSDNRDAISYVHTHGMCDDIAWTQPCVTSATCTSPPAGMAAPGYCVRNTETGGGAQGVCIYNRGRTIVMQNCTTVDYSNNVRWGESAQSGSWKGAGTDGGVNFVVIDNSCGLRPTHVFEGLWNTFAGTSTVALIMINRPGNASSNPPAPDDTLNSDQRGPQFAARYRANSSASVGWSWRDSINSVTTGSTTSCPFGGGGHGIQGCGAHITVSADSFAAGAEWARDTENWVAVRNDDNDATGDGFYSWAYTCNYDCNAHPMVL